MDRQYVDLIETHEPVDDAVRRVDDFANKGIIEFRNCPAGFREWD
jgi:hypothetical protein